LTSDTARVIVSTAIEETNPGIVRARELGIPVVHRAKALASVLEGHRLVAVAGTCGKSTVTAMLGHLLASCGVDPVVVNGAQVVGWDLCGARVGSVRNGAGEYAVAEVDESDKSLSAFRPYAAIVTNASADHYSEEEMNEVFDAFIKDVPGPVIDGRCIFKGDRPENFACLEELAAACPLPGGHNRANAMLALAMASALGAPEDRLASALASFPGVERRLQRVGCCGGAAVYDDYAHNPEKLAAMWRTLADAYPKGIAVVWRPHGYGPLNKMLQPLAEMFTRMKRPQDELLLLPVYDAGGTADRSVNSDALAARVPGAREVGDLTEAESLLRQLAPAVGAIVTAGARDPGLPVLARRLTERENT
jgi:UDP-N-acetylmuramate--alanine ligase